jgi:hypothetical protein
MCSCRRDGDNCVDVNLACAQTTRIVADKNIACREDMQLPARYANAAKAMSMLASYIFSARPFVECIFIDNLLDQRGKP